jgi:hypothetical protein
MLTVCLPADRASCTRCLPENAVKVAPGLGIGMSRLTTERNDVDGMSWNRHISESRMSQE